MKDSKRHSVNTAGYVGGRYLYLSRSIPVTSLDCYSSNRTRRALLIFDPCLIFSFSESRVANYFNE
jgi:hypothetical protein